MMKLVITGWGGSSERLLNKVNNEHKKYEEAMAERKLPWGVKRAQKDHLCIRCDGLIKKGDMMTMRFSQSPHYSMGPSCLKCDGRYPEL